MWTLKTYIEILLQLLFIWIIYQYVWLFMASKAYGLSIYEEKHCISISQFISKIDTPKNVTINLVQHIGSLFADLIKLIKSS